MLTHTAVATEHGSRDADAVWHDYVTPQRWPRWAPQIGQVDYALEQIVPGTKGTVVARGVPVRAAFRILSVDPVLRQWTWRATCLGVHLHLTHEVWQTAGGCGTRLTTTGPAPLVVTYLPLARLALRRLVQHG